MLGHAQETLVPLVDLFIGVGLLLAEDRFGCGFRVIIGFGDNFSKLIFDEVDGVRLIFDFDKHETWHVLQYLVCLKQ
jgi:hypothetical protein